MLTHHAYYIEDSPLNLPAYLGAAGPRAELGLDASDPNFVVRSYEKFGIEEARELASLASLKTTGETALFMIATSSITSEAQQALLKLFEEPQVGVFFVLLVPHGTLLPTLRSRCLPYAAKEAPLGALTEAEHFVHASPKARSEMIAAMLKEEEWARERVRAFLTALEMALYQAHAAQPSAPLRGALEDVGRFREYLGDRSPSLKMLLEHLAATLPVF